MQLLSICLWGWKDPSPRIVPLRLDRLNVITGDSKTGKSALLDIVDYCFGRSSDPIAGDRIRQATSWYGIQLMSGGSHLFIGRPQPEGTATSDQAFLLETSEARLPTLESLRPNIDTGNLRRRLSSLLGIGEHATLVPEGSLAASHSASVGQAILFCFQKQGIVSDQDLLFHRQSERRVHEAFQSTFPYFLGAEPWSQASREARARDARRAHESAQSRLAALRARDANIGAELQALLAQAFAAGLTDTQRAATRQEAVDLLRIAALRPTTRQGAATDVVVNERIIELQATQLESRRRIRALIEERALLRQLAAEAGAYGDAVREQATALTPLGLIAASSPEGGSSCPLCNSSLEDADATVAEMRALAETLGAELSGLTSNTTRRAEAIAAVDDEISRLRDSLEANDSALDAIRGADQADDVLFGATRAEELAFQRGQISASVRNIDLSSQEALERAQATADRSLATYEAALSLARETDSDLASRLATVNLYLTHYARTLDVDHSESPVTLDARNSTVRVNTRTGSLRLSQVGSAANYMGLHVAVHLALHRYFAEQTLPVPRFLMLDQPSQPFYPEDSSAEEPTVSSDRKAVENLYETLFRFAQDHDVQVIVSDHVNLRDKDWFADSVVETWREGAALIPAHWEPRSS